MIAASCVPLLVGVLLGATARRLGRLLPPGVAVRLLTVAALVTALATGFILAAAGGLLVAQLPWFVEWGQFSVPRLQAQLPVPVVVAGAAAAAVSGLLALAVRRAVLGGRDLVRAELWCRRLGPAAPGLVVVDDPAPDAFAVPGMSGRVVVSTAMLHAMPADEQRVLLAHERAHLIRRHHVWIQGAEVAAAANPLLRPVAAVVRLAAERDADEIAATQVGDRELAARALARAGLARAAARRAGIPRFGTALAAADGDVTDRARALLAAPPPGRRVLAGVIAAIVMATVAATVMTAVDTETRFETAQHDHRP